jgi:mannose-6-phosphate isomerase-like protein (cupin superfamily)
MAKAKRASRSGTGSRTKRKVTTRRPTVKRAAKATRATKRTVKRAARTAARRPKAQTPARAPQRFTVSHHREEDFAEGLRAYAKYRDLGLKEATGGMVQAHVIRMVPPCNPEEVSKLHYHDVEFQMVYVLRGWMESEFEGEGKVRMNAGSCWIQPPRIPHRVLDYSDDCEVLEIILPADFETTAIE